MKNNDLTILKSASEQDILLFNMSDCYEIADEEMIKGLAKNEDIKTYIITEPCDEFPFLHEGAVIEFHGKLFSAWYNNQKFELTGRTPVRFSVSEDKGKTWSTPVTVADDESGKILYCPPVFGIDDGRLYMFINQMVSADHIHTLDLYVYNQTENKFERIRSKAIPFKLNTNVYKLPSGKLMICGRTGDLDGFPATPAVLISDSGKIDADWRIVKIQENEFLPDGRKFEHPETSAIICGNEIYVFCRNDYSDMPILYISGDEGETWSAPIIHNIPFYNSKIYSGILSDGRCYCIGNIDPDRKKLGIFFSEKNEFKFKKGFLLQDGYSGYRETSGIWHYPCACEFENRLYIVYSADFKSDGTCSKRGLVISVVDLAKV